MAGSLANPEIDAVDKGRPIAPVLFHVGCHYENTIIIIAVGPAIRSANHPEYRAAHL